MGPTTAYSIAASALNGSEDGTSRPTAFALLLADLVCTRIGRSAGLASPRMRSTYDAGSKQIVGIGQSLGPNATDQAKQTCCTAPSWKSVTVRRTPVISSIPPI